MTEKLPNQITLAHGAGGKQTSALIHEIFAKYFDNPFLTADDAAVLPRPGRKIAMSTDGFVVSPAFFPGGNIGELSICGTVNDLTPSPPYSIILPTPPLTDIMRSTSRITSFAET